MVVRTELTLLRLPVDPDLTDFCLPIDFLLESVVGLLNFLEVVFSTLPVTALCVLACSGVPSFLEGDAE